MSLEGIREKLRLIQALARKGVGGEAENAKALFTSLCQKYNIDPTELTEVSYHDFAYSSDWEKELLIQLVCRFLDLPTLTFWPRGRRKRIAIKMTEAQAGEVNFCYAIYRRQLKKEQQALLGAFFIKHNLLAPYDPNIQYEKKDLEEQRKARLIAQHLSDVRLRKPLPYK